MSKPSFWRCLLHQLIGHTWRHYGMGRFACPCGAVKVLP